MYESHGCGDENISLRIRVRPECVRIRIRLVEMKDLELSTATHGIEATMGLLS
jgi:hypothetical protein